MFYEKIDLYKYFSVPREGRTGGILTGYCRERYGDLAAKKRPAMLVIPGGGYEGISARESEPVALRFLGAGFCAFVLEYTVKAAYPVPLIEASMAMAFIRERAKMYGLDPEKAGVVGFSAGGHLAGMLATLYSDAPVCAVLGKRHVRPDAAILSYAVLTTGDKTHGTTAAIISGGDEGLRARLSLEMRVTKDCPPVFLWHTMEDDCVPVENSLRFAEACRAAGVPFELHIFEKGPHGMSVASRETETSEETFGKISHLAPWTELALGWLKTHGFEVCP